MKEELTTENTMYTKEGKEQYIELKTNDKIEILLKGLTFLDREEIMELLISKKYTKIHSEYDLHTNTYIAGFVKWNILVYLAE